MKTSLSKRLANQAYHFRNRISLGIKKKQYYLKNRAKILANCIKREYKISAEDYYSKLEATQGIC